jgi:hypothetical protein
MLAYCPFYGTYWEPPTVVGLFKGVVLVFVQLPMHWFILCIPRWDHSSFNSNLKINISAEFDILQIPSGFELIHFHSAQTI